MPNQVSAVTVWLCFIFCVCTPFIFDPWFTLSPYGVRYHWVDEIELTFMLICLAFAVPMILTFFRTFGEEQWWFATMTLFAAIVPICSLHYGDERPHDFVWKAGVGMAALFGQRWGLHAMFVWITHRTSMQEATKAWERVTICVLMINVMLLTLLLSWDIKVIIHTPGPDLTAAFTLSLFTFVVWAVVSYDLLLRFAVTAREDMQGAWLDRVSRTK